jgi:MinD-like ATPase involved in chromosome partitioning or flagellar assembly
LYYGWAKKLTKCIAFHSYKGGTGKTTIGANFAACLTRKGYKVSLIDLDVYAPSLQSYFDVEPSKSINDYLYSNAEVEDVMVDMTPLVNNSLSYITNPIEAKLEQATLKNSQVSKYGHSGEAKTKSEAVRSGMVDRNVDKTSMKSGKLWVGFCSTRKEDIFKLEGGVNENMRRQFLKRFILLREQLISTYDSDYIVIDTSPGIRYWSINALAVADILFLTLKMGDLDIEGTKKIVDEIYTSFTKFGTRSYLLLNRVSGYCVPHTFTQEIHNSSENDDRFLHSEVSSMPKTKPEGKSDERSISGNERIGSDLIGLSEQGRDISDLMLGQNSDLNRMLSDELRMNIISSVPCYCDIQFVRKEFLTALQYPGHPFAVKVHELISTMENLPQR